MNDRTDRVAFVTGGARGIGWSTAEELLADGWRVVIADLNPEGMPKHGFGPDRLTVITLDVRDRPALQGAVDQVAQAWGSIDALVTSAGVQRYSAFEEFSDEDWDFVWSVNLRGVVAAMQAAGRHMLRQASGSIVNIASVSGYRGAPGRAAYAASKAAIISVTQTAAVEWATRGVRVNAVAPGYVETDLIAEFVGSGRLDTAPILQRTPLRRMAQPCEIARAIRFLLSDCASYITGQTLAVDGGFLADFGVPFVPHGEARMRSASG